MDNPDRYIGGIDEAGRGPMIGPMVVGGFALPESKLGILEELGVTDSKKLSPKRRESIAAALREIEGARIVEIVIPPSEIDAAVNRPNFSLNGLTHYRMAEAISRLEPDEVYVDLVGTSPDKHILTLLRLLETPVKIISSARADSAFAITGAASIIAKVRRDREIAELNERLTPLYGPLGSGYPSDPKSKLFLRAAWREEGIFRKSWSSYRDLRIE